MCCWCYDVINLRRHLFSFSGQNLVPEPPLQVQEVVEEWRNPAGAARRLERVAPMRVAADHRLGLPADPADEQRQPRSLTSEQQPARQRHHRAAAVLVLLGQLLLVLVHELCDASAAAGAASPQLSHQRGDDILKHTNINIWVLLVVFSKTKK